MQLHTCAFMKNSIIMASISTIAQCQISMFHVESQSFKSTAIEESMK